MLLRACNCVPGSLSKSRRRLFCAADDSLSGRLSCTVDRRDALCAMGAAALWTAIASLITGVGPARAQKLTEPVPEVDSLSIRVITDSFQQVFAPPARLGNVEVRPFSLALTDKPPRRALESEWGVSALLETRVIALGVSGELRNTAGSGRGPWHIARSKALSVESLGLPSLIEAR
jgi:hypothetical protein